MKKKPKLLPDAAELRRCAERRLREQHPESRVDRAEADTQRLVHELQVHQVELEMQNEQLQQSRNELESALEKYSDLYDFAPVGYLTLDREGSILEANLAAASLLGVERSRLATRRLSFSVSPPDVPAFTAFLRDVFEADARQSCEITLIKEGKALFFARIEAEVAASGRECRAVVTDISERKQAEVDRLILSKLESTGILAGGIAHDFNNLLTVILLDLELVREKNPSLHDASRLLDEARDTALAASGLTRQLITFAEGGAPVRKPVCLSASIQAWARPALSGSDVGGEFFISDDLWTVEADEAQIGQVLRNMVLNAREAMLRAGLVSVRAENVVLKSHEIHCLPSGNYVRLSIADRGTGITKEVLPKIFDPYFSTKERGQRKGMGLGLTICHTIIEKHGGSITVESQVGIGTTFHIYLPASQKPAAQRDAPAAKPTLRPVKVLLMDDEEGVREVVGMSLRQKGHEVELVEDGQAAIDAYRTARSVGRPFDVAILDLTVRAGLGAQETIPALLKIDPGVRAIVMSGYADHPLVREPGRYGFKDVLPKPFGSGQLLQILAQVLAQPPAGLDTRIAD